VGSSRQQRRRFLLRIIRAQFIAPEELTMELFDWIAQKLKLAPDVIEEMEIVITVNRTVEASLKSGTVMLRAKLDTLHVALTRDKTTWVMDDPDDVLKAKKIFISCIGGTMEVIRAKSKEEAIRVASAENSPWDITEQITEVSLDGPSEIVASQF
jgi:predicted nucleic acid-binding protein